jgi:hypothetical protein
MSMVTLPKSQMMAMELDNEDSLDAPPSVGSDTPFMTPSQRKVFLNEYGDFRQFSMKNESFVKAKATNSFCHKKQHFEPKSPVLTDMFLIIALLIP